MSADRPLRTTCLGCRRLKQLYTLLRSFWAPAIFLTLIVGWLMPPLSPWMWTRFVLLMISIPARLPFLFGLTPRHGGISRRSHIRGVLSDFLLAISQIGLTITFLAYQAWLMGDGILRPLVRVSVTRRNLLQWVTAAQAKHAVDLNLYGIFQRMAGGVLFAVAALVAVSFGGHQAMPVALPFILVWAASLAIARWISEPPQLTEAEPLSSSETRTLRLVARRTWRFFEKFVSTEDHALPPDNFQEEPKPVVAHRTSPTNIGLYLVSTIAVCDFGWLGKFDAVGRIETTLTTMHQLELFRGHFFNWYDTRELRPLDPKYVSSVDSGNLAGHLLVLANSCRELVQRSSIDARVLTGLQDSILLLQEALAESGDTRRTHTVTWKHLCNAVDALATAAGSAPGNVMEWASRFAELRERAQTLDDIAQTLQQEEEDAQDSELRVWAAAARDCVESHARDVEILIPWARLPSKEILAMAERPLRQAPEWAATEPYFRTLPPLGETPERFEAALRELGVLRANLHPDSATDRDAVARIDALSRAVTQSITAAAALTRRLLDVSHAAEKLFYAMDFTFLFDNTRKLFSIGYPATDGSLDPNCYDLLASEARLTSFIAIAKGDVPSSHWFRLGRSLTPVGRGSALISYSRSMFEYLIPALVMRSPTGSMLNQTYRQVVRRQIELGIERLGPWGVSESAYNARDLHLTYQYSSFGVPGLGLKRGLREHIVVAAYATALAAMVNPYAATRNFARLAEAGGRGIYVYYEALDYTSSPVPPC